MIYEYTTAKGEPRKWILQQFIISGLRRLSYRTPMRADALRKARVKRGKYKCATCGNIFGKKQISVDHIEPVIPTTGLSNWHEYIERLFCTSDKLQILCNNGKDSCHKVKSKLENAQRREYKRSKKDDRTRTKKRT